MNPDLDSQHCFFTVMWIWDKEKSKWPPVKEGRIKTSAFDELGGLSGKLEQCPMF